jgi:hypothetical protein
MKKIISFVLFVVVALVALNHYYTPVGGVVGGRVNTVAAESRGR